MLFLTSSIFLTLCNENVELESVDFFSQWKIREVDRNELKGLIRLNLAGNSAIATAIQIYVICFEMPGE